MPIYAAQITGFVAGQLGVRASCVDAVCGDTDSVHFIPRASSTKDVERYFAIMAEAGYQAPRVDRSETLIGGTNLGVWADEMPTPSAESYVVRPKRYSHRYWDPAKGGSWRYKQAIHGFSRFTCPEAEATKDRDEAARLRQVAAHEAMRKMLAGEDVVFEQRRAPRKGREAVRTGSLPGCNRTSTSAT